MPKKVPAAAQPLHPLLRAWIRKAFRGRFTEAQEQTLPHILAGRSVLLSSPTGSGKTLAGFLGILDHLIRAHGAGTLGNGIHAIYVSPLRALTYDIEKNLRAPLEGVGLQDVIRVGLRTGDTPATERARMRRKPPHILLTTPESLAIMLPQKGFREALQTCRFVIVDELHALAENKRGSHLMVSLERLEGRTQAALVRIGLSATAAPLDLLGRFLTGSRVCGLVQATKARGRRVEVLSPLRKEPYPPAGYTACRVVNDVAAIVKRNRSVIIFCNTRSGTENISMRLKGELPDLAHTIEAHHASLDRDVRLEVEDRLKRGELRAVVCSTSLELGIDIGGVDCVVMISTPKGINRALQRIGRSGHSIDQESHGILVATNINDLMECVMCAEMTRDAQLDPVKILEKPLDVLAQHLVGLAMEARHTPEECFEVIRRAFPFHDLARQEFDRIQKYLEGGGRSLEKQYRETFGKIVVRADGVLATPSPKVEREYLANVGVIASEGMVSVWLGRRRLGQIEESFLKRLKEGDIFVLAGRVVRLIETGVMEVKVEDAKGRLPTVPTWNASKMPLASGLARAMRAFRTELSARFLGGSKEAITDWLVERFLISTTNAQAMVTHCQNQLRVSSIPTAGLMLIERFHERNERDSDDPGLLHFFFHSLIGRTANDALSRVVAHRMKDAVGGNALVTIDDYGFLLTLKPFQDMELAAWRELFAPQNAGRDLEVALKDSSLVQWQFRGVAQTGLMVPRNRPGQERRVKQLQWSSEVLFRVLSQHEPDHPLLEQARREATHTFLDLPRAQRFLDRAASLEWRLVDVPVVTPFSFGIFASKIKEGMMMEDPEEAIERLWREFEKKTGAASP